MTNEYYYFYCKNIVSLISFIPSANSLVLNVMIISHYFLLSVFVYTSILMSILLNSQSQNILLSVLYICIFVIKTSHNILLSI